MLTLLSDVENTPTGPLLTAAGTDKLGEFTSEATVQGGKSVMTKSYTTGLKVYLDVAELPDDTFMFFGSFNYTTNNPAVPNGHGRFANAFVVDHKTSFDSRNDQPQ